MTEFPEQTEAPPDYNVWIESGRTDGGQYFIGFRCGDAAWAMTRFDAQMYAMGVLQLAQRAEYDSAIARLLIQGLGMDLNTALTFIAADVRKLRAPVKVHDSCRLGFRAGTSHRGLKPFLTVLLDDQPCGQWELTDARSHALGVFEVCEAVELDALFTKALTGPEGVGVDDDTAAAVVNDLRRYRWSPGDSEEPVPGLDADFMRDLASRLAGTSLPEDTK